MYSGAGASAEHSITPASGTASAAARRARARPRRTARWVIVGLLAIAAVAVAVAGAFMHRWASPVGLILAVGAGTGVCVLARHAARSRVGIGVVAGAWLTAVLLLAQPRPAGDVVIAGDPAGLVFLLGGASAVAVTLGMGVRVPSSVNVR
ncbi:hypothetical protein G1H11_22500 [Phytoactinopolyspora alkaliphila]|uniref:Uncharacterized protein n=1 Tax=Phytoactinopolyspora alkaliphila TaxID=1783498 RepID=A0A6N9YSQ8_9ACTN|nr:DUF6113 family protein [Phytoactinopolyspora alkaliphila]NED98073.1 hypothetical protein [Phytoactinopolyspora alkaliphila]